MKKNLAFMAIGMASGVAGSFFMYKEYKNGNMSKMLNKVTKAADSNLPK